MCRILALKSEVNLEMKPHLEAIANVAKNSEEYQGHGWGLTYYTENEWKSYHNINPIWEDDLTQFGRSNLFLVHARSAFQNEGIEIENNMPFFNEDLAFVFNGELRGVRIREQGRIGAEKVFNFVQRFRKGSLEQAMNRAIPILEKRSEYIRAMNFVISDGNHLYVLNYYNEDPDYFGLHIGYDDNSMIIASKPYGKDITWTRMDNYQIEVFA